MRGGGFIGGEKKKEHQELRYGTTRHTHLTRNVLYFAPKSNCEFHFPGTLLFPCLRGIGVIPCRTGLELKICVFLVHHRPPWRTGRTITTTHPQLAQSGRIEGTTFKLRQGGQTLPPLSTLPCRPEHQFHRLRLMEMPKRMQMRLFSTCYDRMSLQSQRF